MAEAKIMMQDGISIEVSGTAEEVAAVVKRLRSGNASPGPEIRGGQENRRIRRSSAPAKIVISDLIDALKAEEFFKSPRGLGDVRQKLAEMGHHYPVTTLSGAMQNQARKRQLRRYKENSKYVYVQ